MPEDEPRTLREAQAAVDASIAALGGYWPPLANLARLFEECGELARAVNQAYGPKAIKPGEAQAALAGELGDALYVLLVLANSLGVDAHDALADTLAKVRGRVLPALSERPAGREVIDGPDESTAEVALTTTLAQLYAALADADPLAPAPLPVAAGAHDLAAAFAAAGEQERPRVLLRALDEAIAALEVAAALAEAQARPAAPPAASAEAADDPLAAAYAAFAASQPAYQALYHYRNALAARVRLEARQPPPAVAAPEAPTEEPSEH